MISFSFADIFESLSHQRYNLKYILDKLPISTAITSRQGVIIYYNQAQSQMDGIKISDALGKKETDIYDFLNFPDVHQICQTRGKPILGFVWPYRTLYNKIINAAYWVFPLFKGDKVIASLCFTQPVGMGLGEEGKRQQPIQWPDDTPITLNKSKMVGGNLDFQHAVNTAINTSDSPSPVLIAGETGTGKEMMARLIHESSQRSGREFMAINCAAIPDGLLEGLLFGTVKGGFTGAVDRAGLIEEANGGTLFLDEIDSMPLELQPKLLRVLQEKNVRRVGSKQEVPLDIKIISAVGCSLATALSSGRLRPDLFYRLAVIIVEIPPLRQRMDDIEALLNYFLNKHNKVVGKRCCGFSETMMGFFKKYNWPGNVRELEHLVAGAINLSQGEVMLDYQHLPMHYQRIFNEHMNSPAPTPLKAATGMEKQPDELRGIAYGPQTVSLKNSIRDNEKAGIVEALSKSKGNVAQAARALGLSRQLLAYKMRKYNITRDLFIL